MAARMPPYFRGGALSEGREGPASRRHGPALAAVAVALVVVLPLLAPGFTLVYDMVFVPRPRLSLDLLGVSPSYPRAVPTALLVALASHAVTGAVVQKLVLLLVFGGAALGAARLVPTASAPARIAGGLLYAWNPFTYERLLLGQWALLLGYAVLPWAIGAALRFRRHERGAGWRVVLALAGLTAATPYLGIIGGATTLAVALWPAKEPADGPGSPLDGPVPPNALIGALLVAAAVAVSLPWLLPTLLHTRGQGDADLAITAFRARSDSPLGTVGSLLTLGGSWRTDLAPPGRGTLAWIPAFGLIAAAAVVGWRALRTAWPAGARRGLAGAAGVGLLLAVAPTVPGLREADTWLAGHVPGGGFLRDSQKFAIPYALVLAVCFGLGVSALLHGIPRRGAMGRAVALAVPLLPIALAPTLAFGAWGRLHTANYPPSWSRAEAIMSTDPTPGALLTLPWHAYLPFSWNHDQTVHQPTPEFFSRHAVVATALEVGGSTLPGEDPWSRLAGRVVRTGNPLAASLPRLGIRYVLLFREADWKAALPQTAGLTRVLVTPDLILYRGLPPGPAPRFPRPALAPVLAGDAAAAALVAAASMGAWRARRWRRSHPH